MTENNAETAPQLTEQQLGMIWAQQQLDEATKYLAKQGIILDTVYNEVSTYVTNQVAIFKIRDKQREQYWVIAGDVPTDYAKASLAKDYKEAARHFSLNWQLKAEKLMHTDNATVVQRDFAQLLVRKAEALYSLID